MMVDDVDTPALATTGVPGLDEILGLIRRLELEGISAIFLEDPAHSDLHELPALMTGIIELGGEMAVYGSDQHILRVHKMRGMDVATGAHRTVAGRDVALRARDEQAMIPSRRRGSNHR